MLATDQNRSVTASVTARPGCGSRSRTRRPRADQRLPEPLSEGELEVLALIAAGKSNRAIAAELVVTEGTVKTHAKSIFRKFGAHRRPQALAQARERGLL